MSQPSSSKDSLRERIDSVQSTLAGKQLTLSQVSQRSQSLYGRTSKYFIPHNLYYELTRGGFTPSVYQFAALSRISGYQLSDWLRLFGFDLESIARLQVLLPAKRTVLIDSSLVDRETIVPWFRHRRLRARNEEEDLQIPRVAPLSQLLEFHQPRRVVSVASKESRRFIYAKIGWEDAFAFPDLLPGSIVGIDPSAVFESLPETDATSRLFLVEHSKGIFCSRLRRTPTDSIIPVSEKLPYGQVRLRRPSEVNILGAATFEIRPLVNPTHPQVPPDLARRWTPTPLKTKKPGGLGQLLRSKREQLKLSLQTASAMSRRVAAAMGDHRYFISPSSLSDYEASEDPPRHFHKIVTLCALYGIRFADFLERIGILSGQLGKQSMPGRFIQTRSASGMREIGDDQPQADSREFFHQLLETLPDVPFFLRNSITELSTIPDPSLEDCFWIGGETNPLHPALKDGVLAVVNRRKKKPIHDRSKLLWEQPIYLLLLRGGGYLCACCGQEDRTLVLHPYPQNVHAAVEYRARRDAEIVGQVVTVVRRLRQVKECP